MSKNSLANQRNKLFHQQSGLCHWCKRAMIAPGQHNPQHKRPLALLACTIDHLYDKWLDTNNRRDFESRDEAVGIYQNMKVEFPGFLHA